MSNYYCEKNNIEYRYYKGCDTHKSNIPEFPNGLDKNKSLDEVIRIAKSLNCHLVTKNGRGKWYIKANRRRNTYDKLNVLLDTKCITRVDKDKRNHCYLLKYDDNQEQFINYMKYNVLF